MEDSFDEMEFKSIVNPSPVYKTTKIKLKPPTKLALKKTLRRSSMYDKLLPSVENCKINMVDVQSTETSSYSSSVPCSPKPVKPRKGFIIVNNSDDSSLVNNNANKQIDNVLINDSGLTSEPEKDTGKVDKGAVEIVPSTDEETEVMPENCIIQRSECDSQFLTADHLKQNELLSRTKFESIQNWVLSVEPQNKSLNKAKNTSKDKIDSQKTKKAINSTFALDKTCVPFDKWMLAEYSSEKSKEHCKSYKNISKENKSPIPVTPNHLLKKYLGSQDVRDILHETSPNDKVIDSTTKKDVELLDNVKTKTDLKVANRSTHNLGTNSSVKKRVDKIKTSSTAKKTVFPKTPTSNRKDKSTKNKSNNDFSANAEDALITPVKQMINNNDDVSKLLDNLYGNSWHKNKEQIFTEPRQPKKIQINRLREPRTEKKVQEPLYRNPYLDSEKEKTSTLLKTLQKQRIQANIESPFFARPKCVDDDTPSPTTSEQRRNQPNEVKDKNIKGTNVKSSDDSISFGLSDLEGRLEKKKQFAKPTHLKFGDDNEVKPAPKSSTKKPRRRIVEISDSDSNDSSVAVKSSSSKTASCSGNSGSSNPRSTCKTKQTIDNKTDDLADQITNITIQDSSSDSVCLVDSDSEDEFIRKPKKAPVVLKTKQPEKQSTKPATKEHTFLSSLSKNVPNEQCDPSALIYKNNFKKHRDVLTKKLFSLFNEKIFDNCLAEDTPLDWNARLTHTAGLCRCMKKSHRDGKVTRSIKIQLSTKVLDSADRLRDTLVHEMCHAATYVVNEVSDGHGPLWKAWANRAMRTFPELPAIERCHNYAINYKYTYKCTSCGYSFGRHSKSLDCERKRCGYCHGKFEVLLNKMNQGEKKSVPCTPKRGPNAFALFVKENYALHRSPGVNHQDLMKLLGKKYAETKTAKNDC